MRRVYFSSINDVAEQLRELEPELTADMPDSDLHDVIRGVYSGRYEDVTQATLHRMLVELWQRAGCDPDTAERMASR